jgi:hypothetical protein
MTKPVKAKDILKQTHEAVKKGSILYSAHANERMLERKILRPEIEFILSNGHHEIRKDKYNEDFESWDYAIKGTTVDGRALRIIVAIVQPNIFVITAIDLDA